MRFSAPDAVAALIEAGSEVNAEDSRSQTALHLAAGAWAGRGESAAVLLGAGADATDTNRWGATPLHLARLAEVVRLLLSAGADVAAQTEDGRTPLHYAALRATPGGITALLDAGADAAALDESGRTPCELASRNEELQGSAALARLCSPAEQGATHPRHVIPMRDGINFESRSVSEWKESMRRGLMTTSSSHEDRSLR